MSPAGLKVNTANFENEVDFCNSLSLSWSKWGPPFAIRANVRRVNHDEEGLTEILLRWSFRMTTLRQQS